MLMFQWQIFLFCPWCQNIHMAYSWDGWNCISLPYHQKTLEKCWSLLAIGIDIYIKEILNVVFWSWYKEMSGTPPEKKGLLSCREEWFPELDTWCFCITCTQVQSCMGKPPLLDNIPLSGLFLPLTTPEVKGLVNLTPLLKIFNHLALSWFQLLCQS